MNAWVPHITVACVIHRDGKYLMVEERDKFSGELVFNQPAGHLDDGESISDAAVRETLEETGWRVELTGVLCMALYRAPTNSITYYRTTFLATPLERVENAVKKVLSQGYRTGDIFEAGTRRVGTREMGDAVLAAL